MIIGALTPGEIIAATEHGATAVKLFPASIGGPAYLKALRDPFPTVPICWRCSSRPAPAIAQTSSSPARDRSPAGLDAKRP
jgi:2-keto-3-deoxy-6-phosphogluconate aldolase